VFVCGGVMTKWQQRSRRAPAVLTFILTSVILSPLALLAVGLMPAQAAHEMVAFPGNYPAGVIVISQHQRKLYFTEGDGRAIRYPVAIGMPGKGWLGETRVEGKYMHPDWSPPAIVRRDHPELPALIPGTSPHNPMGVAAITLQRNEVAIHGTNAHMRHSVGTAASYGCIRMYNEDVLDLFSRVDVGTPVYAIP
jgi:lipoprotein-anchoring transpeptidase ErfK/SrfK